MSETPYPIIEVVGKPDNAMHEWKISYESGLERQTESGYGTPEQVGGREGMIKPIQEQTFVELVQAGAVREIAIVGHGSRWYLEISTGMETRILGSRREHVRTWASLDRLARWLHARGVGDWKVRAKQWAPKAPRMHNVA